MSFKLFNSVASRLGLARSRKQRRPAFAAAAEFHDMVAMVTGSTMVPEIGLYSLYQQVLFCEQAGIAGAFVECGVWKGGAVGVMAQANLKHGGTRRDFHLFD